jgi:hypothetical protein
MQVIMVKGHHEGRQRGVSGGGMTPPVASMPNGSNPQGEEQVVKNEHIDVGDVVGLMRSFERMS